MIFYRSFYEAIKNLGVNDQCEIYNAIFTYGLDFQEPELSGVAASFWMLIKPQIDANIKRYENGKKPKQKQNESKTEANQKQTKSKQQTNVNENVNENENELVNISFKLFWDAYSKKVGREKSFKAWSKIPESLRDHVIEKAKIYIQSTPEVKYRKNPETWLNGKCWEDEIPTDEPKQIKAFHPIIFD